MEKGNQRKREIGSISPEALDPRNDSGTSGRKNAHAVIIGIDHYQDERIRDLQLARADAEAVYRVLSDPELGGIPPENIVKLVDEEATQRRIRNAIGEEIRRNAGEDDVVIIYYAGHGSPESDPHSRFQDKMEKYLIPCDGEADKLFSTAISMEEINKFFGRIDAKQVIFFIDSCYSGEAGGRTFQNPNYRTRSVLTDEFLDDLSGEGRLVISACNVNETSLELTGMENGLFTHYLVEGMKGKADRDGNGRVTIGELYDYVYENVSNHARKVGGSMRPVRKGSVSGKIYLTYYQTEAQRQQLALQAKADELNARAAGAYQRQQFKEAETLWLEVLALLPNDKTALKGKAAIAEKRRAAAQRKQQILADQQKILFRLYRQKELPADEYNQALALLEMAEASLSNIDREIRDFLLDLISKKISPAAYLRSVTMLREEDADSDDRPVENPENDGTKTEETKLHTPSDSEIIQPQLTVIRRQMPAAKSISDLKKLLSKIDEILASFPGDRDARQLRYQLIDTIAAENRKSEAPQKAVATTEKSPVKHSRGSARDRWVGAAFAGILLIALGYWLFSQFGGENKGVEETSAPSKGKTSGQGAITQLFRSTPRENYSVEDVKAMLKKYDFFDRSGNSWSNPEGKGFENEFETQQNGKVVYDRASGLMWQQSGSQNYITYEKGKQYIQQLNRDRFAGFSDWRLPTLEEAMTLMEPEEKNKGLYIDPVFDNTQRWIWTADQPSASNAWSVGFSDGGCYPSRVDISNCVRAVRSGQSAR